MLRLPTSRIARYGGLDLKGTGPGASGRDLRSLRNSGPVSRPEMYGSDVRPEYSQPVERGYEITHGQLELVGSLPRKVIQKYIQAHRRQIRYCYERELLRHPALRGKLLVHFVINRKGYVHKVMADQSRSISPTNLRACILNRVNGWRFPKPKGGGEVEVSYPFLFAPSSAD